MKTRKAVIYIQCETDAASDGTVVALRDCLNVAEANKQVLKYSLDVTEEISGRIRTEVADSKGDDNEQDLPLGLSYDEIFEPDPDAL